MADQRDRDNGVNDAFVRAAEVVGTTMGQAARAVLRTSQRATEAAPDIAASAAATAQAAASSAVRVTSDLAEETVDSIASAAGGDRDQRKAARETVRQAGRVEQSAINVAAGTARRAASGENTRRGTGKAFNPGGGSSAATTPASGTRAASGNRAATGRGAAKKAARSLAGAKTTASRKRSAKSAKAAKTGGAKGGRRR